MKKFFTTLLLLNLLSLGIRAQHNVTAAGVTFSPKNLTINAGESVTWTNTSGVHNVNGSKATYPANPEGFLSGPAAGAPWTFSHTFNTPGTYTYQCDPHVDVGMTGAITVVGGAAGGVVITEINYNDPGPGTDQYEYVELYNNTSQGINMTGWTFSKGFVYTFPAFTLPAGGYIVVSVDSAKFEAAFGKPAFKWVSGALSNGGETIALSDASGNVVDSVAYKPADGWPPAANGQGPSLVLCDYDADNNNPVNWAAAITPTGFLVNNVEILANPGADSQCPGGPVIGFSGTTSTVVEDAGIATFAVTISAGNANLTKVTVNVSAASTASFFSDYNISVPFEVLFAPGVAVDTQYFSAILVNDGDIESTESIIFELSNPTNNATIAPNASQFTVEIIDDDTPMTKALVISGVFDAQPGAAGTKGVELKATANIPDLSIFGVEAATNGNPPTAIDTPLPAVSLSAGDCFYVCDDSTKFFDFFGFYPDLVGSAAFINGDDVIALYENNIIVDVFGEPGVDGTGTPWEYTDGWAYRKNGTGPDGMTFVLDNWTYSGIDALEGVPNNASAPNPFPTCMYLTSTQESQLSQHIRFSPNPAGGFLFLETDLLLESVTIVNTLGRPVLSWKNPGNKLDLNGLAKGVYFITFQAGGARWSSTLVRL
jgi:plastocyanin